MYNNERMMWEETYMLFRKKIPGSCQYCAHGVRLEGGQIVCVKKGLLEGDCACRRFHYDPLKRICLLYTSDAADDS